MSLSVPVCLKMTSLTPFFQPKKYSRTNFKRSFSNRWTCPWSGKASIRHKSLPPCSARKLMWNRKCLSSLQQHQVRVANVENVSFGLTIPLKTNVVLLRGGDKILMRVTCGVWIIIWMFGCCCCCFFFLSFFLQRRRFRLCSSRLINAPPPVWLVTSWWPQYSVTGEELRDDINLCWLSKMTNMNDV